jgi:hypothetical protein
MKNLCSECGVIVAVAYIVNGAENSRLCGPDLMRELLDLVLNNESITFTHGGTSLHGLPIIHIN